MHFLPSGCHNRRLHDDQSFVAIEHSFPSACRRAVEATNDSRFTRIAEAWFLRIAGTIPAGDQNVKQLLVAPAQNFIFRNKHFKVPGGAQFKAIRFENSGFLCARK